MLIDIPDELLEEGEREAERSGRPLREVLISALRRAFGLDEDEADAEAAREARAEGGEPSSWEQVKAELKL